MSSVLEHLDCNAPTIAQTLADICDAFDREWYAGAPPRLEEWLEAGSPSHRQILFRRLLAIELARRALEGEAADESDYLARFPQFAADVADEFQAWRSRREDSRERSYSSTDLWGRIAHAIDPVHVHEPGDAIGRYRLLERVGRGGFGEVWKAFDPELNRPVAIKLARSDRVQSPELIQQLRTEARRAAGLKHDGIVPVYDIVNDPQGAYIVSEFIEGETLGSRMRRGAVPVADATAIVVQIARALHHAHSQGVVHRDVKPGNILLRTTGQAVITDFGLAATEEELVREHSGTFGTVRYMSPEQVRGEGHTCDGRTDVYSLGVVLYELLARRAPYPGENSSEYKEQVLTRPARPLRTIDDRIDPELERICLRCLSKRVEDRYATCDALALALSARQRSGAGLISKWGYRGIIAAGVLLFAGIAVAAGVVLTQDPGTKPGAASVGAEARGAAYRMVAWSPTDSSNTFGYDAEQQRFVFNTLSPAAFEIGTSAEGGIDAEVVFTLKDGNGTAGLFWGLQADQDGEHCRAVSVGRLSEHHPYELWVQEFLIKEELGGRTGVVSHLTTRQLPLGGPLTEQVRLRVSADTRGVNQVWVNGSQILTRPEPLPERAWSQLPGSGWGVTGARGIISILTAKSL